MLKRRRRGRGRAKAAETSKQTEAPEGAAPQRATPESATPEPVAGVEQGALVQLRSIVLGSLLSEREQAIARLEGCIGEQATLLCAELDALVRRLESRIEALEVRATRHQSDLREQMVSQEQRLGRAIEERSSQVRQLTNEGVAELRASKFDRGDFSGFLARLAAHLETEVPEVREEEPAARPTRSSGWNTATRPPWHPVRENA